MQTCTCNVRDFTARFWSSEARRSSPCARCDMVAPAGGGLSCELSWPNALRKDADARGLVQGRVIQARPSHLVGFNFTICFKCSGRGCETCDAAGGWPQPTAPIRCPVVRQSAQPARCLDANSLSDPMVCISDPMIVRSTSSARDPATPSGLPSVKTQRSSKHSQSLGDSSVGPCARAATASALCSQSRRNKCNSTPLRSAAAASGPPSISHSGAPHQTGRPMSACWRACLPGSTSSRVGGRRRQQLERRRMAAYEALCRRCCARRRR